MSLISGFDAGAVAPNTGSTNLPAGDYKIIFFEAEDKPTKDGTGAMLVLKFQVCSGEHQNRKRTDRLNLKNKSTKTVEIARGQLSAICRAINVLNPKSNADLLNKPLCVHVSHRPKKMNGVVIPNEFEESYTYKPLAEMKTGNGQAAGQSTPAVTSPAPAQTSGDINSNPFSGPSPQVDGQAVAAAELAAEANPFG